MDYEPFVNSQLPRRLSDDIQFENVCGIDLAAQPSRIGGNETIAVHPVDRPLLRLVYTYLYAFSDGKLDGQSKRLRANGPPGYVVALSGAANCKGTGAGSGVGVSSDCKRTPSRPRSAVDH